MLSLGGEGRSGDERLLPTNVALVAALKNIAVPSERLIAFSLMSIAVCAAREPIGAFDEVGEIFCGIAS